MFLPQTTGCQISNSDQSTTTGVLASHNFSWETLEVKTNHPVREDGTNVYLVGTLFLYFFLHVLLVCKGLVAYVDIIFQCEGKLSVCEARLRNCNKKEIPGVKYYNTELYT